MAEAMLRGRKATPATTEMPSREFGKRLAIAAIAFSVAWPLALLIAGGISTQLIGVVWAAGFVVGPLLWFVLGCGASFGFGAIRLAGIFAWWAAVLAVWALVTRSYETDDEFLTGILVHLVTMGFWIAGFLLGQVLRMVRMSVRRT